MRPLAILALGLAENMLARSALGMRRSAEAFALRLGLVALCVVLGCAGGGFVLAALYDVTAAAWGATPAKLVIGSVLSCLGLAGILAHVVARGRDRRLVHRI
ncbi:MAG: hypothetical protein JNK67_22830 [Alphaproteobacteria bacterium]|nr:hypothetical protein [Alphaproteobacteria bacterium]